MAEYFLDPTVAADGGDGTIGNPWTRADGQVEQYVLDNEITRDTSEGDILHIKSGTRHTNISGSIDLSFYGTPTNIAGLTFRGYTSAARDGGIADLNMGGNTLFLSTGYSGCHFVDCEIHNLGNGIAIRGNTLTFTNCYIHDCNGNSFQIWIASNCSFNFCRIEEIGVGGTTALVGGACSFISCFINQGNQGTGLYMNGGGCLIENCIITSFGGNSSGINLNSGTSFVCGNTLYNLNASTGSGIICNSIGTNHIVRNNYIEGWSGSGAEAILLFWNQQRNTILYGNRWYNCTTGINSNNNPQWMLVNKNNSSLPSSPLTNPVGKDFTISDALKAAATPSYIGGSHISSSPTYVDVGAVQRQEGGAGGGLFRVNLNGGI